MDINQEIVERFVPVNTQIEERQEPGFEVTSNNHMLTIKMGRLVNEHLIDLHRAIGIMRNYEKGTTGSTPPKAKDLKSDLLKLNEDVICAMAPQELREKVSCEIIERDPEAEKYWQGAKITTAAENIHVVVSQYLPVSDLNNLFTVYLKEIKFTEEETTSGGLVEYDNLELLRSRQSRLERLTGIQDRFMIPILFLMAVAIGTGVYFSGAILRR